MQSTLLILSDYASFYSTSLIQVATMLSHAQRYKVLYHKYGSSCFTLPYCAPMQLEGWRAPHIHWRPHHCRHCGLWAASGRPSASACGDAAYTALHAHRSHRQGEGGGGTLCLRGGAVWRALGDWFGGILICENIMFIFWSNYFYRVMRMNHLQPLNFYSIDSAISS